jgi:hypothetical protein
MRRALDAVDAGTADLITTMVASAFLDGQKAAFSGEQQETREKEFA